MHCKYNTLIYKLVSCFPCKQFELEFEKNYAPFTERKKPEVIKTLYIDLSDAQGQVTPKSMFGSCWNSNSSKLLCMSLFLQD